MQKYIPAIIYTLPVHMHCVRAWFKTDEMF